MLSFESDYTEGAHPRILQAFMDTNLEQLSGYGTDLYCERAKEKIRSACGTPEADIYFLAGGTQTNQIVIDAVLQEEIGRVFSQVLEHAGVYKRTPEGRAAFMRFVEHVNNN